VGSERKGLRERWLAKRTMSVIVPEPTAMYVCGRAGARTRTLMQVASSATTSFPSSRIVAGA